MACLHRQTLRETLVKNFGELDEKNIFDALQIDNHGFLSRVKEISGYGGFRESEKKLLERHL